MVPEGAVVSGIVGTALLEGVSYVGVEESGVKVGNVSRGAVDSGVKVGNVSRGAEEVVLGELATVEEVSAAEEVWLFP